jgi:Hint domain
VDINLSYDASVGSAPAGFESALNLAVTYLDALIVNPITVTIDVGYGEWDGESLAPGTSEGGPNGTYMSYSEVVSELTAHATSAVDLSSVASLPASNPAGSGVFLVSYAQEKAWGLLPADSTEVDGYVGFGAGSSIPWDYSTNGTTASGEVDFVGVAEHELTHALGRMAGLQQFGTNDYAVLDLFRYSAPGTLELTAGEPAYFSANGGQTDLDNFSTVADVGDWAPSAGNDAFDAIVDAGTQNTMSAADITEMDVLGFAVGCFAAGTRIATVAGEVPVEALRVGDQVLTARGTLAPVVWLGHRRIRCARHPRPHDVWPVRVRAHAFCVGQPACDLLLSPDHAVYAAGGLMPVRYLVNGATVVQEMVDSVDYWHIELPHHDVLLAEGLAVESFLDTGNRAAFAGAAVDLHPDFARRVWQTSACAPLLVNGAKVAATRRRLLARAARLGHEATDDPALRVLANGRVLAAHREAERWRVALPPGTRRVRLRSLTGTPAHMSPESDDARPLGVAIGRLSLDGRDLPLTHPALEDGWHTAEPYWRWTRGDAGLAVLGARELAFEVAITARYWLPPPGPVCSATGD